MERCVLKPIARELLGVWRDWAISPESAGSAESVSSVGESKSEESAVASDGVSVAIGGVAVVASALAAAAEEAAAAMLAAASAIGFSKVCSRSALL